MTSTQPDAHAVVDELSQIPTAGRGLVRLGLLGVESEAGGGERFERMITAIVREIHPTARAVRANPGDWGIDTFVGELSSRTNAVWQSKYFINGVGNAQRADIRKSFASVLKAAEANDFAVKSWTLALPVDLDGPETKWWDGWRKKTQRERGVVIDLWPAATVEGLLLKPDLAGVRQQFFGIAPGEALVERMVADPEDWSAFDEALFIRQLHEAGISEDLAARRAFFNAEVMTRDVQEREVRSELDALSSVRADLHQMWHTRFEAERAACDESTASLPGLYPQVMSAVESHHQANPSRALRDTLVHRSGLVHHLVEAGHAGWVRDYHRIAEEHR